MTGCCCFFMLLKCALEFVSSSWALISEWPKARQDSRAIPAATALMIEATWLRLLGQRGFRAPEYDQRTRIR